MIQDAVLAARRHWPTEGIPERPDAWLFTVARRRGLDALRREANDRTKLAQLRWPVQPAPDERLRPIFTCCHPALSLPAQIALTLWVVCGLTTAQIARAFLAQSRDLAEDAEWLARLLHQLMPVLAYRDSCGRTQLCR